MMTDISVIEETSIEAEVSVLNALCECYQKQLNILEYSTGENVSEFSIFQEGFKDIVDEAKGPSSEKLILRIIKFIPRLLMAIGRAIKRALTGKKPKKATDAINSIQNMSHEEKVKMDEAMSSNPGKSTEDTKEPDDGIKEPEEDEVKHSTDVTEKDVNPDIPENHPSTKSYHSNISVRVEFENERVYFSGINVAEVKKYLKGVKGVIEELKAWDPMAPKTMNKEKQKSANRLPLWKSDNTTWWLTLAEAERDINEIVQLGAEIDKINKYVIDRFQRFISTYESKQNDGKKISDKYTERIGVIRDKLDVIKQVNVDIVKVTTEFDGAMSLLISYINTAKDRADQVDSGIRKGARMVKHELSDKDPVKNYETLLKDTVMGIKEKAEENAAKHERGEKQ
ncbi:MAG: hypothetical protein IKA36_05900 [Clostridia bacterium]|nr:hypothetical protein [Clostridia bacterium]